MKRIILSVFAIILFIGATSGQGNDRKFKIGLYGDLGTSWLKPKSKDLNYSGLKSSYGFGLMVDYYFAKNYIFNTGFYVNYAGGKVDYLNKQTVDTSSFLQTGTLEKNYSVQYLELPINLKLKTNQIGYLSYFAVLGLNTGFRLKSVSDDKFLYNNNTTTYETLENDAKNDINFFKFSFNIAAGAEYEVNNSLSVFGQLSFGNGLFDILKTSTSINPDKHIASLNKMALTVGVIF